MSEKRSEMKMSGDFLEEIAREMEQYMAESELDLTESELDLFRKSLELPSRYTEKTCVSCGDLKPCMGRMCDECKDKLCAKYKDKLEEVMDYLDKAFKAQKLRPKHLRYIKKLRERNKITKDIEAELLELINDMADWFKHDDCRANQVWSDSYIKRLTKIYHKLYGD